MNTLTFSLARAAKLILEQDTKEKENKLLNTLRFTNLPRVGNSEPEGGTKMGSLMKMAEKIADQEAAEKNTDQKKVAAQEEENVYSPADRIKIAAAHLCNFIAAVKADGGVIKTASAESGEIDEDLIIKVANLYVIDHYDLYKEAGFSRESLKALIDKIRAAAAQSKGVQKAIHPMASNVQVAVPGGAAPFAGKGYLKSILDAAAAKGSQVGGAIGEQATKAGKGLVEIAGKKPVQIGAGVGGGLGLGYGLSEILGD